VPVPSVFTVNWLVTPHRLSAVRWGYAGDGLGAVNDQRAWPVTRLAVRILDNCRQRALKSGTRHVPKPLVLRLRDTGGGGR